MLVVISDLHFEEEKSRNIAGQGVHEPIEVPRNIHLKAFTKIFSRLDERARRDGAKKMDLVLAGDIFELHRTALWFRDNPQDVRPYVSATEVEADLEAKLLALLQAINEASSAPRQVLAALRRLIQEGRYVDESGQDRAFPVLVQMHYIPGNHDRLTNSTPAVRRAVRELLGLPPSDAAFPHVLTFDEERTLIRHGHEYDYLNFSQDYREVDELPLHLPEEAYDGATFGDFVAVEVASRISEVYREHHGDTNILGDPLLRQVYERILEFDDLRPQHAMPNYLLYIPTSGYTPERIWRDALKPVLQKLLGDIHDHPFLTYWLDKWDKKMWPDLIDLAQGALALRVWDWQVWNWMVLSLNNVQRLSERLLRAYKEASGPERMALREETVRSERHLFVVGGHTHKPAVELIGHRPASEQYYVNTGTWRQQLPAAPDFKSFGRVKTLTYAVLYGPDEDRGTPPVNNKIASLDYWSGVTRRWSK